jgi:succinate-semialdehyde dehydrogenase/glutarate-semialdehyde dehydrogenase
MLSEASPIHASADRLESFNPRTGEKLGEVPVATPADVAAAVGRAREAQRPWVEMGVDGRNEVLDRLRAVLIERADEIARVVSSESGKPPVEPTGLIAPVCATIKLHSDLAKRLEPGEKVSATFFVGSRARIFYEPLGVAGFILPWNFPFELGMKHMIPALAAGNAVVQKPSEANPLIGELIASLFRDAGVPDGVVQMVHGYADTGRALVDEVDAICFVGSTATGKKIMRQAAETLTPVVLELGGNDAAIVREDADLDLTARGLVNGTCYNAGQVCNGIERIYAPHHLVEPLVEKILAVVGSLRPGWKTSGGDYDLGPIIWEPQLAVYEAHTRDALEKGAQLHCGGEARREGGGLYWPPTVLTGMSHEMKMMQEETFGPFLAIMGVDSDDEAIRLANDSQYGLGSSVWTRDTKAGEAIAHRLKAGSVMVNNAIQSGGCVTLPFGGEGDSGVGRAQGEQAYFHYVATKSVMTCPDSSDLWMPYEPNTAGFFKGLTRLFYARKPTEKVRGLVDLIRNRPRGK